VYNVDNPLSLWPSYPFISVQNTVKLIFLYAFISQISRLYDVTKITGREYSKSHAILVYYLVQQAKTPKLRAPK